MPIAIRVVSEQQYNTWHAAAAFDLNSANQALTVSIGSPTSASSARRSFVDGLHSLGTYDAAGLSCSPINISAENYGKFPTDACTYAVTVKNGKFVVSNGGKPIKAKLVGDPDLLASSTYDPSKPSSSSGTTTTAAK